MVRFSSHQYKFTADVVLNPTNADPQEIAKFNAGLHFYNGFNAELMLGESAHTIRSLSETSLKKSVLKQKLKSGDCFSLLFSSIWRGSLQSSVLPDISSWNQSNTYLPQRGTFDFEACEKLAHDALSTFRSIQSRNEKGQEVYVYSQWKPVHANTDENKHSAPSEDSSDSTNTNSVDANLISRDRLLAVFAMLYQKCTDTKEEKQSDQKNPNGFTLKKAYFIPQTDTFWILDSADRLIEMDCKGVRMGDDLCFDIEDGFCSQTDAPTTQLDLDYQWWLQNGMNTSTTVLRWHL